VQTRNDYFALQDALENLASRDLSGELLSKADDDFLRVLSSRLRTGMTRDVGTRQTFMFRRDTKAARPPSRLVFRERDGDRWLTLTWASPARWLPPGPWWHRQRRLTASVRVEPSDRAPRAVTWNVERGAFVLETGVGAESRVFLVEDDELIEGPAGWRRHASLHGDRAAVWIPDQKGTDLHGT
jgi:hypothetical protein